MTTRAANATIDPASIERVPLTRRVLADLDTPLSVYLKLAQGPHSFLLESVEGGEKWGRYSIIGLPARRTVVVEGHLVTVRESETIIEQLEVADPLDYVERYHARYRALGLDDLPRFCGGLVGYKNGIAGQGGDLDALRFIGFF